LSAPILARPQEMMRVFGDSAKLSLTSHTIINKYSQLARLAPEKC
jgi:hypothetical protein